MTIYLVSLNFPRFEDGFGAYKVRKIGKIKTLVSVNNVS